MRGLYNLLWYPALPFALRAAAGTSRSNRMQRMGHASPLPGPSDEAGYRIWLHSASVGEIEAVRPLALPLVEARPRVELFVTTMTETGCEAARRRLPNVRLAQLAPLDFPHAVQTFLASIRPRLVLIAETEIWPNYFIESARAGARIAIVNGRLSTRSMRRYRWVRPLVAMALIRANLVLAQTEADADRFVALGAPRENVMVTGNIKFDSDATCAPLRPELERLIDGRLLLVAGSTAPGEEQHLIAAFLKLRVKFSDLVLAIAPRHPERSDEVARMLSAAALPFARARSVEKAAVATPVLLVDTTGELAALYRRAAIAFVGGSLIAGRGGQNLAEPAIAGAALLFGPHHENQRDLAQALIKHRGALVVESPQQLVNACHTLLGNDQIRHAMAQRAGEVIAVRAGAAARSLPHLLALAGAA